MIFSLLASGDPTEDKQSIDTTPVAEQNISAQVVANEQEILIWSILKVVLFLKQLKTTYIRLAHNLG